MVFIRSSVLGTKVQQCWFLPELLALARFQRKQLLARADALCSPTRSLQPIYKLVDGDVRAEFLWGVEFLAGFLALATRRPQKQVFFSQTSSLSSEFGCCVWVLVNKEFPMGVVIALCVDFRAGWLVSGEAGVCVAASC